MAHGWGRLPQRGEEFLRQPLGVGVESGMSDRGKWHSPDRGKSVQGIMECQQVLEVLEGTVAASKRARGKKYGEDLA